MYTYTQDQLVQRKKNTKKSIIVKINKTKTKKFRFLHFGKQIKFHKHTLAA